MFHFTAFTTQQCSCGLVTHKYATKGAALRYELLIHVDRSTFSVLHTCEDFKSSSALYFSVL